MIQIGDTIISLDIFEKKFCCDLAVCKGICCVDGDSGAPLEEGEAEQVFRNPLHPYTKALIAAIPIPDPRRERARAVPDFSNTEFSRTGTLREVEKDHFVLMEGGDAG